MCKRVSVCLQVEMGKRTKNPAPQDSPPAVGRMSDIIPLCRSASSQNVIT